jgi:hypothetical protein
MSSKRKSKSSDGGSGAGTGDEVFPDLHHKMSKKIAQLTKVIYHLNTKNEDHTTMLETLDLQHKLELEQLAKDSQSRMASQKEMSDMKQKLMIQSAQMEKLGKKHNAEKQKTLAEIERYKENVKAREEQLISDWQLKSDQIGDEVIEMNKKFSDKVESFDRARKDMQAKIDAALNSSGDANIAMKKAHESEVEELVRNANEKYQDMLVQQLQIQENQQKEYEQKILELQKQMENFGQERLEKELGQLRAKMAAEAQEALMRLKRESDSAMQNQREELMGKLEKVLSDLKVKAQLCTQLEEENSALKAQMDGEIGSLLDKHKEELASLDFNLQNANIECSRLKQQVTNLQQDVADAQDVIAERSLELNHKGEQLVQKDDSIHDLKSQLDQLKQDLLDASQTGAAGQEHLTKLLQESHQALQQAKNEYDELEKSKLSVEADVVAAKTELLKLRESLEKKLKSLEKNLDTANADNAALRAKLDDALRSGASENETLMTQMAQLRQKLMESQKELASQQNRLTKEHDASVALIEEKARKELDGMKKLNDALFEKNNEVGREIDALKSAHKKELDRKQLETEEQMEELRKSNKVEEDKLKLLLAQLENQLANLTENADSAKQALEKEHAKVKEKVKSLKLELDAKKKEGEGAQGVIAGLKSQIESLREELKASQKAFRDKMDMGLAKLEEDWQRKMDTLVESHGQALVDQQSELEAAMGVERQALIAAHEEMQTSLQTEAQEAAEKASAALTTSENERIKLEFELKSEIDERAIQIKTLNAKWADELSKQKAEADARLEELGRQLLGDADAASQAMLDNHAQEIEKLKKAAIDAAEAAKQGQVLALQEAAAQAAKVHSAAVKSKEDELNEQFRRSAEEMTARSDTILAETKSQHEETTRTITEKLASATSSFASLKEAHHALETELKDEKARANKQSLQDKMALERLSRENDTNLRNEKEASQKALMEQQDRFEADMRLIKMEFAEDRDRYERSLQDAQLEYSALEEKYQNRESRPDDLARIQQLEYEMVEKDELVKSTRDEMLYLKRELMNREESYNSKFNAKPVVGVMNVIKDPATSKSSSTKSTPGMSTKSNKPTNFVRPQPGMGMGMMGSIGNSGPPGIPGGSKGPVDLPSGSREGRRR